MDTDQSVSREISAPAEKIWQLLTDLSRMGEWSGESRGGKWLGGASGPSLGAQFKGANRNGIRRWNTKVTIDEFTPTSRFSFHSALPGVSMAQWTYDIEETPNGCRVTESWTDLRPGFFKPISALASGVKDRPPFALAQMTGTLERIAEAAEQ